MEKYLLADEIPIVAQHKHWASLWKPITLAAGGLLLVVLLDYVMPARFGGLSNLLWWGWFALVVWLLWKWLLWRVEWLVATDKRLLVNYGLVNQGVSMINLGRVSDLTYTRSSLGQLLGYGTMVRESAPHPGSLHEVRWVKNPHKTYLTICAAIFSLQDRMFGLDEDERDGRVQDDGPPPPAPRLNPQYGTTVARYSTAKETAGPAESLGDLEDEQPVDTPGAVRYGGSQQYSQEPFRQSPDLSEPSLRHAHTGAFPYRRSTTDASDDWSPTTNDPDD
jgi:hypothetical protein